MHMKKKVLPQVDPVILNSFCGKRPGFWIFISLLIILILLIFLLLFLPGIIKGGKYVSISLPLKDVSVTVDGKYLGPIENNTFFIKAGVHTLTFKKADKELYSTQIKIGNPLFATMFIHYTQHFEFKDLTYSKELLSATKALYINNLVSYSAITEYSDSYFYPPIIYNYFSDSLVMSSATIKEDYYYTLLHITSEEMLKDLISAENLLKNNNVEYETTNSTQLGTTIDKAFSDTNYTVDKTEDNPILIPTLTYYNDIPFFSYPTSFVTLGKTTSLAYPENNSAPVKLEVKEFAFAANMISETEYAQFVKANPEWALSNLTYLVENNLVDENYLQGINLNAPSALPIRNISYKAALAYCEYLSKESGLTYRLPTEAEWEVVANSTQEKGYSTSLLTLALLTDTPSSVMGGLWEYTSTYYLPFSRLSDYNEAQRIAKEYKVDDIVIKGGSYINTASVIKKEDVGITKQYQTSPYVGIRLVVEK